jgi:hypothetical protein
MVPWIKCPSCNQAMALDDSIQGERNRCDKCGTSFVARDAHPQHTQDEGVREGVRLRPPPPKAESLFDRPVDVGESGTRQEIRASGRSSVALWIVLGSGCLGVLLCTVVGGIVLAVWFTAGAVPSPAPPFGAQQPPIAGAPLPPPSLPVRDRFFVANPSCLSLSRDGTRLAVGSYDKTVRIFHVPTQKEIAVLAGHDESIHSVAMSPDGQLLASAAKDRLIRFWNVDRKERVHTLQTKSERPVVRFLPDGK